jgi:hypothetical protein
MKKLIFIFSLILVTVVVFSQGQPKSWSGAIGYNPAHNPPSSPPADDLQLLPADPLLWSQGPGCGGSCSSEIISEYGLVSNCADDFIFTSGKNITAARWWFGVYGGPYSTITSWNITIYDNATCLPGDIVQQWIIPFNLSNEFLQCTLTYSYWADLSPSFTASANTVYWISVQTGDHVYPGQWGWDAIITENGCQGAFKSDYFGFSQYVPTSTVFVDPLDFSFELYGNEAGPVETPVSTWALFIGIGLILIVVVIRFRRLI